MCIFETPHQYFPSASEGELMQMNNNPGDTQQTPQQISAIHPMAEDAIVGPLMDLFGHYRTWRKALFVVPPTTEETHALIADRGDDPGREAARGWLRDRAAAAAAVRRPGSGSATVVPVGPEAGVL